MLVTLPAFKYLHYYPLNWHFSQLGAGKAPDFMVLGRLLSNCTLHSETEVARFMGEMNNWLKFLLLRYPMANGNLRRNDSSLIVIRRARRKFRCCSTRSPSKDRSPGHMSIYGHLLSYLILDNTVVISRRCSVRACRNHRFLYLLLCTRWSALDLDIVPSIIGKTQAQHTKYHPCTTMLDQKWTCLKLVASTPQIWPIALLLGRPIFGCTREHNGNYLTRLICDTRLHRQEGPMRRIEIRCTKIWRRLELCGLSYWSHPLQECVWLDRTAVRQAKTASGQAKPAFKSVKKGKAHQRLLDLAERTHALGRNLKQAAARLRSYFFTRVCWTRRHVPQDSFFKETPRITPSLSQRLESF